MAEVRINGVAYEAEPGTILGDLLAGKGQAESFQRQAVAMPCGGHGRCGKCRVIATGALSPLSEQ